MTPEEENLLQIAEENHFITPEQKQEIQRHLEVLVISNGVLNFLVEKGFLTKETKKEIKSIYKILKGFEVEDEPEVPLDVSKIKKAALKSQSDALLSNQSSTAQENAQRKTSRLNLELENEAEEEEAEEETDPSASDDDDFVTALPTSAPKINLSEPLQLKQSSEVKKGENRPIEIEGYTLLKVAGRGNQAVVFKAQDQKTNRIVAVKILNPNLVNETRFERFFKEAKLLTTFDHPNIAKGYDFGESNGYNYFVMEYLKGVTSKEHVEQYGPMNRDQLLAVAEQITYALIYANSIRLVHRDIKPDNIMIVGDFKQIKLCDLGLAKALEGDKQLTQVGQVVGTPNYISPEIARGEVPDIRSDIYALGATLYFLATTTPPFLAENATAVMRKHIFEELESPLKRNPKMDPQFSELICNMMPKDPMERPQTPEILLSKIKKLRAGKSIQGLSNYEESSENDSSDSEDLLKIDESLLKEDEPKKSSPKPLSKKIPLSSDSTPTKKTSLSPDSTPTKKTSLSPDSTPTKKMTTAPEKKKADLNEESDFLASLALKKSEKPPATGKSEKSSKKPSKPISTEDILDRSKQEGSAKKSVRIEEDMIPPEEDLFGDIDKKTTPAFKKEFAEDEEMDSASAKKKRKGNVDELQDFLDSEENLEVRQFEDEFKCRNCGILFPKTRFVCPHCYQPYCVYCRHRLKTDPRQCHKCGRLQPNAQTPEAAKKSEEIPPWGWALIATVVIVIIIFFVTQSMK